MEYNQFQNVPVGTEAKHTIRCTIPKVNPEVNKSIKLQISLNHID